MYSIIQNPQEWTCNGQKTPPINILPTHRSHPPASPRFPILNGFQKLVHQTANKSSYRLLEKNSRKGRRTNLSPPMMGRCVFLAVESGSPHRSSLNKAWTWGRVRFQFNGKAADSLRSYVTPSTWQSGWIRRILAHQADRPAYLLFHLTISTSANPPLLCPHDGRGKPRPGVTPNCVQNHQW